MSTPPPRIISRQVPGLRWRSLLGGLGLLVLLVGPCRADVPRQQEAADDDALPLPRWSEEEIRAFRENFAGAGSLLPAAEEAPEGGLMTPPLSFGPRLDAGSGGANGEIRPRLRAEDMRLFLPDSLLTQAAPRHQEAPPQPTALSALKEVTPEFLAAGAAAPANEYWIDPGSQVTEMHQQEMVRFLEFHGRDALIKLHVLILPGDRKLPADCNLDAMCSGSLARGTACLLVYPLGEPWRARLFLSKAVHDHASQTFMQETARTCVEEALHCSDVHDQLHGYLVELSTRLFWLQKALGTRLGPVESVSRPLAEIAADAAPVAARPAAQGEAFPWLVTAILAGAMAGGTLVARPMLRRFRQWQRLRRQSRVWMLPEVETIPRLGGAFTGGGGGMMRYARTAA